MKQTIDQFYDQETLRRLQMVELDILKKFDKMCEKHGLEYFAAYGTVLGAVRHQGFIPWDDDIDVGMPRKDYERLAELVPIEFGEGYSLLNGQIDPRYPFMTSRIMKKGTEFRMLSMKNVPCDLGIFLDIFCFDDMPDSIEEQRKIARSCWIIEKMCILRNTPFPNLPYRGIKRVAAYVACGAGSLVMKVFPRKKLHEWMQSSAQRCNNPNAGYLGCPFGLKPFESVYPKSMIYPLKRMKFEDMEIPIPNDPHAMLLQVYGESYMTPPPEGKRSNIIPYKLSFEEEYEVR